MAKILREPTAFRRYYPSAPMPDQTPDVAMPLQRRRGPGTRVPPMLVFPAAFMAGVWLNEQMPWPMQTAGSPLPLVLLGSFLLSFGFVLFGASLFTFVRSGTAILLQHAATRIVTHGPYAWSRNPQYVAFVSVHVGACILANTFWPLVPLPLVIAVLNRFVIAREERHLLERFGRAYHAYAQRVRRWL
jgi:protein-S-isoprenylcysteine O-methyltransferase Ste14